MFPIDKKLHTVIALFYVGFSMIVATFSVIVAGTPSIFTFLIFLLIFLICGIGHGAFLAFKTYQHNEDVILGIEEKHSHIQNDLYHVSSNLSDFAEKLDDFVKEHEEIQTKIEIIHHQQDMISQSFSPSSVSASPSAPLGTLSPKRKSKDSYHEDTLNDFEETSTLAPIDPKEAQKWEEMNMEPQDDSMKPSSAQATEHQSKEKENINDFVDHTLPSFLSDDDDAPQDYFFDGLSQDFSSLSQEKIEAIHHKINHEEEFADITNIIQEKPTSSQKEETIVITPKETSPLETEDRPINIDIPQEKIPHLNDLISKEDYIDIIKNPASLSSQNASLPSLEALCLHKSQAPKTTINPSSLTPPPPIAPSLPKDRHIAVHKNTSSNEMSIFSQDILDIRTKETYFIDLYPYASSTDIMSAKNHSKKNFNKDSFKTIDRQFIKKAFQDLSSLTESYDVNTGISLNIFLQSLLDDDYMGSFINLHQESYIANTRSLIFSVSQNQLRFMTSIRIEKMIILFNEGFSFCLRDIDHDLPDLQELASVGFRYIKMSRNNFINPIRVAGRSMDGTLFAEECRKNHIQLIIEDVNTQEDLWSVMSIKANMMTGDAVFPAIKNPNTGHRSPLLS